MSGLLRKSAFLFDLDGTLVDSSAAHEKAYREALSEHAAESLEGFDYESLKGRPTAESFRKLGIVNPELLDRLVSEKQRRYRAAVLAGESRLVPGAKEILQLLRERHKRLFLVTGGSRRSTDAVLDATGIQRFFEGVITADDGLRGKPAPDSFLLCLERFGLSTAQALGIEDSLNGIQACAAAGLDAVLVNNPELESSFRPSFSTLELFRLALWQEEFARV